MEIHRVCYIKKGKVQHFITGSKNPFEIPNIYINKEDKEVYYILSNMIECIKSFIYLKIKKLVLVYENKLG